MFIYSQFEKILTPLIQSTKREYNLLVRVTKLKFLYRLAWFSSAIIILIIQKYEFIAKFFNFGTFLSNKYLSRLQFGVKEEIERLEHLIEIIQKNRQMVLDLTIKKESQIKLKKIFVNEILKKDTNKLDQNLVYQLMYNRLLNDLNTDFVILILLNCYIFIKQKYLSSFSIAFNYSNFINSIDRTILISFCIFIWLLLLIFGYIYFYDLFKIYNTKTFKDFLIRILKVFYQNFTFEELDSETKAKLDELLDVSNINMNTGQLINEINKISSTIVNALKKRNFMPKVFRDDGFFEKILEFLDANNRDITDMRDISYKMLLAHRAQKGKKLLFEPFKSARKKNEIKTFFLKKNAEKEGICTDPNRINENIEKKTQENKEYKINW